MDALLHWPKTQSLRQVTLAHQLQEGHVQRLEQVLLHLQALGVEECFVHADSEYATQMKDLSQKLHWLRLIVFLRPRPCHVDNDEY